MRQRSAPRRLATLGALGALAPWMLALPLALASACAPEGESVAGAGLERNRGLVIRNPSSDPTRPYYHSFGVLPLGRIATHVYELVNTDPAPVTVERVIPACTCTLGRAWFVDAEGRRTDGSLAQEPVIVVPPGAVLHLEFRLDSRAVQHKNTDRLSTVSIACDSPNAPYLQLEMHSLVEVALQATPSPLELRELPQSSGGGGATRVATARTGSAVRVLGLSSASPGLEVSVQEAELLGERLWQVSVDVEPGLPIGPLLGEVVLAVSGPDGSGEGEPFVIPVRARIVEDVVVLPGAIGFGRFDPASGASAEALVRALVPGERVRVLGAELEGESSEGIELEWAAEQPDAQGRSATWRIRLHAPPALAGRRVHAKLRVELDHPTLRWVEARLAGELR